MKIATFILRAMALIGSAVPTQAVTVVLDFNDPAQANTSRWNAPSEQVSTFDITQFELADTTANRTQLYNSILAEVIKDYSFDIGYVSGNSFYNGQQLDIDFEIGDHGTAPANGDPEHFFVQIGSAASSTETSYGRAVNYAVRGTGGVEIEGSAPDGAIVASIFSSNIDNLYFNKFHGYNEAVHLLTGTISHEIGHTLGLQHLNYNEAWTTKNGIAPLMSSGATGLPNGERRTDREFSTSGADPDRGNSNFNSVAILTLALGTRPVPEPSTAMLTFAALGILTFRRKRGN